MNHPTLSTLLQPKDTSQDEFDGLLEQLRTELSEADAQVELLDAARYNDGDVVRAVLTVHPPPPRSNIIHCVDNHQNTPLHMAAANGHVEIVSLLLQCGADPTARNDKGNTPLHWAAANGQQGVVDVLLKHDAVDVLQRNTFGRSALTEGFTSQNTNLVQSLLEHKTATEERLMQTDNTDDAEMADSDQGVIHEFQFGGTASVRIRELPIAKNDQDSILGQANPEDDTTGFGIWAASLVTAQWLVSLREKLAATADGAILELGAGCGVPALAVAAVLPCRIVYATDFNPRTVDNLRFNIQLNKKENTNTTTDVQALEMNWQNPSTWPTEQAISVLIGSDLIYQADMVPLLLQTIQGLLSTTPGSVFYYVAPATGRQGQDEFFEGMRQNNFYVREHAMDPAWTQNPLASQDDDSCFLHFHELQSAEFKLYEFTRQ